MALTNCSIDSTNAVIVQDQGNITSQVLYIAPDPGWVVSAVDFKVADKSYSANSSSLEFINGTNGVDLDIALYSITLADTVAPGAADNKVEVTVDFENGYTMPGADTTITIDIDGDATDANLINVRAVLLEKVNATDSTYTTLTITHNTSSTGGTNPTYSMYDGSNYNVHYFNATTTPGTQLLLATITVDTIADPDDLTEYALTPQPHLTTTPGTPLPFGNQFLEGLEKFELIPVWSGTSAVQTVTANNSLQSKTYYLYFTDDSSTGGDWPDNYADVGAGYYGEHPSVTTALAAPVDIVDLTGFTGDDTPSIWTLDTSGLIDGFGPQNIYDAETGEVVIPGIMDGPGKILEATGDEGGGFTINISEITFNGNQGSIPGFPQTLEMASTGKRSIAIPDGAFPNIEGWDKRTYLMEVTGINGTKMGPRTVINGSMNHTNANNTVTNTFTQYKDPTIKVAASIVGEADWRLNTPGYTSPAVTQVGIAKTFVDSLSWRSDAKGNTSVDFELRLTDDGGKGFRVIKADPVGWFSGDENKDSDLTEDSTDHGNVVSIRNLAPNVDNPLIGKLTGTIDFEAYGTEDATFTIDLTRIFDNAIT